MSVFCCPVCGETLQEQSGSLRCAVGHCFDRARSGYVNLLLSQQSHNKRHGDDKRMLQARRAFLDKGYYAPLREALTAMVVTDRSDSGLVLDAGCGEGYYTAALQQALPKATVAGVDISKDALALAARRGCRELAVASAFSLPLADSSCDLLTSVFAPCATEEFYRVLKPGGMLIRAVPTERHLFGLKAAIYEQPYENPPENTDLDGFCLIGQRTVSGSLRLTSQADIEALFEMTPYYYKTGAADQQKLAARTELTTETGFLLLCWQKQ